MSDFDLHCIKRRMDELRVQVEKAWSDEARRASAEARHKVGAKVEVHGKSGMKNGTAATVTSARNSKGYYGVKLDKPADPAYANHNIHEDNLRAK